MERKGVPRQRQPSSFMDEELVNYAKLAKKPKKKTKEKRDINPWLVPTILHLIPIVGFFYALHKKKEEPQTEIGVFAATAVKVSAVYSVVFIVALSVSLLFSKGSYALPHLPDVSAMVAEWKEEKAKQKQLKDEQEEKEAKEAKKKQTAEEKSVSDSDTTEEKSEKEQTEADVLASVEEAQESEEASRFIGCELTPDNLLHIEINGNETDFPMAIDFLSAIGWSVDSKNPDPDNGSLSVYVLTDASGSKAYLYFPSDNPQTATKLEITFVGTDTSIMGFSMSTRDEVVHEALSELSPQTDGYDAGGGNGIEVYTTGGYRILVTYQNFYVTAVAIEIM